MQDSLKNVIFLCGYLYAKARAERRTFCWIHKFSKMHSKSDKCHFFPLLSFTQCFALQIPRQKGSHECRNKYADTHRDWQPSENTPFKQIFRTTQPARLWEREESGASLELRGTGLPTGRGAFQAVHSAPRATQWPQASLLPGPQRRSSERWPRIFSMLHSQLGDLNTRFISPQQQTREDYIILTLLGPRRKLELRSLVTLSPTASVYKTKTQTQTFQLYLMLFSPHQAQCQIVSTKRCSSFSYHLLNISLNSQHIFGFQNAKATYFPASQNERKPWSKWMGIIKPQPQEPPQIRQAPNQFGVPKCLSAESTHQQFCFTALSEYSTAVPA